MSKILRSVLTVALALGTSVQGQPKRPIRLGKEVKDFNTNRAIPVPIINSDNIISDKDAEFSKIIGGCGSLAFGERWDPQYAQSSSAVDDKTQGTPRYRAIYKRIKEREEITANQVDSLVKSDSRISSFSGKCPRGTGEMRVYLSPPDYSKQTIQDIHFVSFPRDTKDNDTVYTKYGDHPAIAIKKSDLGKVLEKTNLSYDVMLPNGQSYTQTDTIRSYNQVGTYCVKIPTVLSKASDEL